MVDVKYDKDQSSNLDVNDPIPNLQVEQGPIRSYLVTEPSKNLVKLRTVTTVKEKVLVLLLTLFAVAIRTFDLKNPNSVVFDEVHFGGFASQYINGTFFMDVHPPLAKMLFAAVASYAGFKGDFKFEEIGDVFPKTTPYVVMRFFSAILGAITVDLMYFTLRFSGVSLWVALAACTCFTIENSFVTISRYILLDSPLIFFIAFAAYSFKKYEIYPTNSINSIKALFITGLTLGFAVSSKWVGLFTIAWIGLLCVWRLWFMIGDLTRKPSDIIKVAFMKLIFLLGIPIIIYLFMFKIHFDVLSREGEGSGFMTSKFRSVLEGNTIPRQVLKDVGVTSSITLRHVSTMGGYLHSHPHFYETGSKQQQITLYGHLDSNNQWLVELNTFPGMTYPTFQNLTDRASIKLLHEKTFCRLHSHDHPAPASFQADWQREVSCYGYNGFNGDINDDWIIEIDKDNSEPGIAQERVIALKTQFRLKHSTTGCYLFSHDVKLPEWGYGQQEVSCAYNGRKDLTLWYVEGNENINAEDDAERISYDKPTFWEKFVESNVKMWDINKNLVDTHYYASYPESWLFLRRGINYWSQENKGIYLLGNLVMWWATTLSMIFFVGIVIIELLAWQLGKSILQDSHVMNFHIQVIHYGLGFLLHYIPSFLMKRQLFLHHYLPAYYFGIMALAHALDIVVVYVFKKRRQIGYAFVIAFVIGCVYCFFVFRPIIYALPWTKDQCEKARWFSNWDFPCVQYHDNYEDYKNVTTAIIESSTESA